MKSATEINLNDVAVSVASLEDREVITSRIMDMALCGRKLDFTKTHLNTLPVERLRHILFAALVTNKKIAM